jgi:pimeloyl-ACP methyl ester carboxylesterase
MAFLCLVHGSTQGVSGWDLLVPELRKQGHEIVTPELPADQPEGLADHYAQIIARSIGQRADATVVAHSASGMFLPLVPQRVEVKRLIFLAAFVPKPGASLLEQFKSSPDMLNREWLGKDPSRDDQVAMQFLFHDCTPEVARWALTTRRLMNARAAIMEPCPLARYPETPRSYIVCSDDRTFQPQWSRRVAREVLGVDAIELPGGHCPYISRPGQLAEVLSQLSI